MDNELIARALTKGIAYTENGGEPDLHSPKQGKSGEMKSIYQYTPATWEAYSREVLGREVEMDADTESYVTYSKVKKWLDEGKTPKQILSMWNAGGGEPDAWSGKFSHGGPSKGVNKYGVNYDVPTYVKKGLTYSKQFYEEMAQKQKPIVQQSAHSTPQTGQQTGPKTGQQNPLEVVLSMMRQAKAPQFGGQLPQAPQQPFQTPTSSSAPQTKVLAKAQQSSQ